MKYSPMKYRRLLTLALAVLASLALTACASVAVPVRTVNQFETEWLDDTELGSPMQDIYVESDEPGMVVRFQAADLEDPAFLAQTTYRSTTANPADLFMTGPDPLGPFPQGEAHPFTVGEWIAADSSGTYTVSGENAHMDFTFQNLVPNSVYTIWCMTMDLDTQAVVEWPCGAADGSESIFHSDADGNAGYTLNLAALPETTDASQTALAIAYHSDGLTHGESPGEYGKNVHIQLSVPIPPANDPAWQEYLMLDN